MMSSLRSLRVILGFLPIIFSFIRDYRGYIVIGQPRPISEEGHRRRAALIRDRMAEMGPTFVKGAQVLAMREDIIMPIYAIELRKLQDRVPPFPTSEALAIIENNLGQPAQQLFTKFDEEPVAAASLGQVYQAWLGDKKVAVKVLRPGVEELVRSDLVAIRFLLWVLGLFVDDNLMQSFISIAREYERMILLEMDFRNERRSADRFRQNFRGNPRIVIPVFYERYVTAQVAVLEFVEGIRVDDKVALESLGMSPDELIDLLTENYVRMAVVDGFIHADPHPGNLLIDAQKRLVILDYGMAVEFNEATRLEMLKILYAVVKRDVDGIVEGFYRLGMVDTSINRGTIRDAAQTLLDIQLQQDLTPRQIQEIVQEILDTFYRFPVRLPSQFVYLLRAISLLEGIALHYNPRFNAVKHTTPVVRRMLRQIAFRGKKPLRQRVEDGAREVYFTIRELTMIIHRLEREQLQVRIHEADLEALHAILNSTMRRMVESIGLAAFAICFTLATVRYLPWWVLLSALVVMLVIYIVIAAVPISRGKNSGPYFK